MTSRCLWCSAPFAPRHGGKPQKFCTPACRVDFHTKARAWIEGAVEAGRVSVAEIKGALPAQSNVLVASDQQARCCQPPGYLSIGSGEARAYAQPHSPL